MKWKLCPKCLGNAKIPAGGTSSAVFETCPVCNGQRIIPEYQPQPTEGEDAPSEQDGDRVKIWIDKGGDDYTNVVFDYIVHTNKRFSISELKDAFYNGLTRKP